MELAKPDPKPGKRLVADQLGWAELRAAKLGWCRVCGDNGTELHHLVSRAQGGDDVEANLVSLCTPHHTKLEAGDMHVAMRLRLHLSELERAYVAGKKSQEWLDKHYPTSLVKRTLHGSALSEGTAVGQTAVSGSVLPHEDEPERAVSSESVAPLYGSSSTSLIDFKDENTKPVEIPPGQDCPMCKRRVPKPQEKLEAPRNRTTFSVRVPKDEQENGYEILHSLIDLCTSELKERLGRQDDVPAYYTLTAVLHDWLTGTTPGEEMA